MAASVASLTVKEVSKYNTRHEHKYFRRLCAVYPSQRRPPLLFLLWVKQFFAARAAPKIVSLCGSNRIGSFNQMLHDHAAGILKGHGAVVTPISLKDLDLPLYDPALEATGCPANAQALRDQLISAGEYAKMFLLTL
jgi:NADPH-dependent FMN reductase